MQYLADVRLAINPETKDIVLAKGTKLDVDLKLSVKMNYKFSSKTITASNLSQFGSESDTGKMYITPFSLSISPDKINSSDTADIFFAPSTLIITLSDGSCVTAFEQQTNESNKILYRFYTDHGDGSRHMPVSISPNDIKSVEANGISIF